MRRWFRVRVDRDRVGELVLRALTFGTDSNRLGTLQCRPDDFVAGEAVGSGVRLDDQRSGLSQCAAGAVTVTVSSCADACRAHQMATCDGPAAARRPGDGLTS